MDCDGIRELLSAELDGEADAAERGLTEAHLTGCAACRAWLDDAARVTRLVSTQVVPPVDAELVERVLTAVPAPRRRRLERLVGPLRLLLGGLGAAQVVLGTVQIATYAAAQQMPTAHGAEGAGHLWHESAAWNVAVGAGFLWVALQRSRPAGVLPILTAFLAMLTLLTVNDLIGGRVDVSRVATHAIVVVGYLIMVLLSRRGPRTGRPEREPAPKDERRGRRDATPRLRLVPHPLDGQAAVRDRAA